jgi:RNA polymerase sigma factor (TIGR02999 family)
MHSEDDITGLLIAWRAGDQDALDQLFPRVYEELRHIAHRRLARERGGHTLGTTALVNEAYLKLVDQTRVEWADRAHFFAVAARVMRRILVDYARRHHARKRGGDMAPVTLDDESVVNATLVADERADMLLALDEALSRLAELDERLSRVVECRFFGGLTEEETANALSVTARTVRRDWVKAKGWLHQALRE